MSHASEVGRVLYRALLSTAGRLSREVARQRTADVFSQEELTWLLAHAPAAVPAADRGEEALRSLVRSRFRGAPSGAAASEELDVGFAALALLNRRLALLEAQAVDPTSDSVTNGVRVLVKSELKEPDKVQYLGYLYKYTVTIVNESKEQPVQLLRRWWKITDSEGNVEEVAGPGVLGLQPTLGVGTHFEYTSFTPLRSRRGSMEGTYSMVAIESGELFDVQVGPFALSPLS